MNKFLSSRIIFILLALYATLPFAQENITISSTGDRQYLLQLLGAEFEQLYPGTKVEIPHSIGSGGGIKALDASASHHPLC